MNYKDYNDYELVYMVRENDDVSKGILFQKYDPILKKVAGEYYSGYKEYGYDYDDFYQEAVICFQKALNTYDENRDSLFYTYMNVCIRRGMQSFCRNISSNKNSSLLSNLVDIDSIDIPGEDNVKKSIDYMNYEAICKKVLYDLPSMSSAVMELRLNGFNYREISILLDIPGSSVEFKSRRGRRMLRKLLRRYYYK